MKVGKRRRVRRKGQIALFDSIMFFIVMLVASSSLLIITVFYSQNQEVVAHHAMSVYGEGCRETLMRSTVYRTWYLDKSGTVIWLPPGSTNVQDIILLELVLRDGGVSWTNFKGSTTQRLNGEDFYGFEESVNRTARSLVRGGYQFAISASYKNETSGNTFNIFISSSQLPSERFASSWSTSLIDFGRVGEVQMTFYLWRG